MVIGFSEIGKIFNDSGTAANRVIYMTCKKHYLIGTQNEVDSCEDCQKEKSGNLPEANRNAMLADVDELLNKIDELKKDFNPYNFCDYEKSLWDQILRLKDKLRVDVR